MTSNHATARGKNMLPQWSRPGMTDGKQVETTPRNMPQWSRPRIGRMTSDWGQYVTEIFGPQWSRPGGIGQMAQSVPVSARRSARRHLGDQVHHLAAMEPAKDRPDESTSIGRLWKAMKPQWSWPRDRPAPNRLSSRLNNSTIVRNRSTSLTPTRTPSGNSPPEPGPLAGPTSHWSEASFHAAGSRRPRSSMPWSARSARHSAVTFRVAGIAGSARQHHGRRPQQAPDHAQSRPCAHRAVPAITAHGSAGRGHRRAPPRPSR
jgi:hypothetical protein